MLQGVFSKLKAYWRLIKSLQTILLLFTGITGFVSSRCPFISWQLFLLLILSLFLTISGTTVFNMIWDRDIDARMQRTEKRPLPSGEVSVRESVILGLLLLIPGLALSFYLSFLYGLVIFAGFFIDFVIYTIWLKRKTAWSIVWGGISGGMPILAGRVLGTGTIDTIGLLLALAILLWIPTHIMTFNIRYFKDYSKAGVPTFAERYGFQNTRVIVAGSSIASTLAFALGALLLGLSWGFLAMLFFITVAFIVVAALGMYKPSSQINFHLFKMASLYMVLVMFIIILGS
ncbi:MAG: heme o synthase [Dysgonamonadaceae bacterium]|jgi:protoheme IX farnesyltransferase|nr:heme o synthase [Dysgonamonadaceae bacterium]MDD3727291.1 heme o synthase [Dysgonamonadaceae bacterium]